MLPNWAYYYLGCAQAALGLGDLEKADEMLEEARNFTPDENSNRYRTWLFYRIKSCVMAEFYPEALLLSDQLLNLFEGTGDITVPKSSGQRS